MKKIPLFLVLIVMLSGCGTTNNKHSSKDAMSACIAAVKGTDFLVVSVPAADSFIANKLIVASVKTTGSNAIDALVTTMSLSVRPAIIVVGDNDEVTAVTLEASLLKLPQGTVRSSKPVCVAGADVHKTPLQAAADSAGIQLVMASNR
ncbi:hypothetical protein [Herminiimonas fonticola]|uniref:Lipoprotein n=1 Tax=Herminiimonas fonticola TaxID=303380 RepID=A0A4R6G6N8_9BURK|nr:hypothetical protein [Herminiimonas fonticola]RBA24166.1 hypothetical protein Hfont_1978 [Herminiimonas fonticola]TDN90166.1 hypothetical protein EV677_2242 [Herminiimonas fonticola]